MVLVLGFLSCIGIGIGIVKDTFQVLVLVLVLGFWYWPTLIYRQLFLHVTKRLSSPCCRKVESSSFRFEHVLKGAHLVQDAL